MHRKRLDELGVGLSILPATCIGSLPEPPELRAAREDLKAGRMSQTEFDGKLDAAVELWIKHQEEAGLDVLVDGEQYREEPIAFFASALRGFHAGGLVRVARNFYRRKPVIVGKIRWTAPITVNEWRRAQALTKKPVKATLLGPYSLMDGTLNRHYPDRSSAALALARAIRQEVDALVKAGCKIVQIDEPTLTARPEEMPVALEAMRIVTARIPAYFILHSCYGDLAPSFCMLKDMPVHNLSLELMGADADSLRLLAQSGIEHDVSIGVVDVQSAKADSPETVKSRLKRVIGSFSNQRVWANPDCGLRALTVEDALARLAAMREAVAQVRRES